MTRRIRFERHCGYWPLPKQRELFPETHLCDGRCEAPLPRGPDPIPTDSPEWFDLVQGKRGQGAAPPVEAVPAESLPPMPRQLRHGYGCDCTLCILRDSPIPKPSAQGAGGPPASEPPSTRGEWFDLVQGKRGQGAAPPVEAQPSLCDHGRSLAVRCEDCGARFVRAMESLANRLSPGGQGTPPSEPDPLVRPSFAWPHRGEP